jgi:hypothetical protein
MARDPKYGVTLNGWERLLAAFEANAGDFPQLESYRVQLAEMLALLRAAATQQAALTAAKQEESKRVRGLLSQGRKLATFMRNGARRRYGDDSEKLVEFGLLPFRGRRRPKEEEPEAKPSEAKPPEASPPAPAEAKS